MKKTFELWEKIFAEKKFDTSADLHFITADEIKSISKAEPRIMAKMDSTADLPLIFKKHKYFLLPVNNGKYAIVRGDGFHTLEKLAESIDFTSRIKFPLTTADRGSSEMQFLDYSFNTGAIQHILNTGPLYQSIRGREYSRALNFLVNKTRLEVSSVQIEVDSGLEAEDAIVLLEAKVGTPTDFIIRQLFYPYRHFRIVSPNKKIIPVFFTYEPVKKEYHFWVYEFTNEGDYNSIKFKETKSLKIITKEELELEDIKPKGVVEYKNLVPQANDLDKVIELTFKVSEGLNNYKDIADYFEFDPRQSSYYREAAEALGLVTSDRTGYRLTDVGKRLIQLPAEKRNIFMVEILSDFNLIKYGLDEIKAKKPVSINELQKLIAKNSNLTGSTIIRRASSLAAWYKWIAESTGLFSWDGNKFIPR